MTFFLVKLLSEFRNQEVSQAVSQNRNQGQLTDNPSLIHLENETSEQEEPVRNGDLDEAFNEVDDRDVALLSKIIRYVVDSKVSQMLDFMMNAYQDQLSQEALDMVNEEARLAAEETIRLLL